MITDSNNKISESVLKRENLVIYLLINYPEMSYKKINSNIQIDDIKSEINKEIIQKLYEELKKGNSNIVNILDIFENEQIINYLSGIMATDFEITEVTKCIDDVIANYEKDKLITKRNNIIKKLEDTDKLTQDEIVSLEKELNELIIKLARMK